MTAVPRNATAHDSIGKGLNPHQSRIVAGMMFALAGLVFLSATAYVLIDIAYPNDPAWIERHLDDERITAGFRVDEARKSGYSNSEIAVYLAQRFSDDRARYINMLLISAPAVAFVVLLLGVGMLFLRRNHFR